MTHSLNPDVSGYVYGYEAAESGCLDDQAFALEALLHDRTAFPPGSAVLEAGSDVGSQTRPAGAT